MMQLLFIIGKKTHKSYNVYPVPAGTACKTMTIKPKAHFN